MSVRLSVCLSVCGLIDVEDDGIGTWKPAYIIGRGCIPAPNSTIALRRRTNSLLKMLQRYFCSAANI